MKKALLVGINKYPIAQLRGCVNDVNDMADFLLKKCGFEYGDIRMLLDERATKAAIVDRLEWLISGLRAGDRVLFHYSGHGIQLPTRNLQGEVDNLDEAICAVDFDWTDDGINNAIRDKEFHQMFSSIPDDVEFIWVSDSCCSQDLNREMLQERFIAPPDDIAWRIKTALSKGVMPEGFLPADKELNLALLSGCTSGATSADAIFDGRFNGAFTYFLLKELNKPGGTSTALAELLGNVRNDLAEKEYKQVPQLEGSAKIMNISFLNL